MNIEATVAICAHNEESYVEPCLRSVLGQTLRPSRIIFVADRCDDRTEDISRRLLPSNGTIIIVKQSGDWKNSISENLELARERAAGGAFVIVDADMVLPSSFLERLLPQLGEFASVSAVAKTDPGKGLLNKLVCVWEQTYRFAPLEEQPRGGCRAVSIKALNQVGGFRDVKAWDTDLDIRLRRAGYGVRLDRRVVVLHTRKMTLPGSISYQVRTGRARRELGIGPGRTLLHSLVRLRPFVLYGYLKER